MEDQEFDTALIAAAFDLAAAEGWGAVSVAEAARKAGLMLDRARGRFSGRSAILLRFGVLADAHAAQDAPDIGPVRERLFDLLMRRFDRLEANRAGILALLRALPTDPASALLLAAATRTSMGWLLEVAGVPATGLLGPWRAQGLVGVWLYALRAWQRDDSADLAGTMAALDRALASAESLAGWLERRGAQPQPAPFPENLPEEKDDVPGLGDGDGEIAPG